MSVDFWLICIVNFLMHLATFTLLPIVPVIAKHMSGQPVAPWTLYAAFAVGLLLAGPFHAYLGDTFKRKWVLISGCIGMLACIGGIYLAAETLQLIIAMLLFGSCFAIAVTGGLTVAIDITASHRRTTGNAFFALAGGVALTTGTVISQTLSCTPAELLCMAAVSVSIAIILPVRIYVGFRAPIGVRLLSLDRFFLLEGYVPTINLMLFAFGCGMLVQSIGNTFLAILPQLLLLAIAVPFLHAFINISEHCHRGTANSTCWLSIQLGLLLGMAIALPLSCNDRMLWALVAWGSGGVMAVALLRPYIRKKRVRE